MSLSLSLSLYTYIYIYIYTHIYIYMYIERESTGFLDYTPKNSWRSRETFGDVCKNKTSFP